LGQIKKKEKRGLLGEGKKGLEGQKPARPKKGEKDVESKENLLRSLKKSGLGSIHLAGKGKVHHKNKQKEEKNVSARKSQKKEGDHSRGREQYFEERLKTKKHSRGRNHPRGTERSLRWKSAKKSRAQIPEAFTRTKQRKDNHGVKRKIRGGKGNS